MRWQKARSLLPTPSQPRRSYQGEPRLIAVTSELLIYCFRHISLSVWLETNVENELAWIEKATTYVRTSPVSRLSMQTYILTYSRHRKREPLMALSSHQGGGGGGGYFLRPQSKPREWNHAETNFAAAINGILIAYHSSPLCLERLRKSEIERTQQGRN